MQHESLNMFIQRRFSKLFFLNELYPLGGGQSLFDDVGPPG